MRGTNVQEGPVLGIIPARAGSKGIPGKNIKELNGRPLLAYAIEAATRSEVVDRLICSTDSQEIAKVAEEYGAEVPFLRPAELATDEAAMQPVLEHGVRSLEENDGWSPNIVLNLQPTQPLRTPDHIVLAIGRLLDTAADSVVTVVEVPGHYNPMYVMTIEDGALKPFLGDRLPTRRQDLPLAYSRDGTVYATRRDVLVEQQDIYGNDCRPLILDRDESINIDTMEDWKRAETILARKDQTKL